MPFSIRAMKSTDPRKKKIVELIKKKSGGNKVTKVQWNVNGTFQAHAMIGNKSGYKSLGIVVVLPEELGFDTINIGSKEYEKVVKTTVDTQDLKIAEFNGEQVLTNVEKGPDFPTVYSYKSTTEELKPATPKEVKEAVSKIAEQLGDNFSKVETVKEKPKKSFWSE